MFMGIRERNELSIAEIRVDAARRSLSAMEHEIAQSTELSRLRANTYAQLAQNAEEVVGIQLRLLQSELSRLEAGTATSGVVLDARDAVLIARRSALDAILKYYESLIQLSFIQGVALENWGLERERDGEIFLSNVLLSRAQ